MAAGRTSTSALLRRLGTVRDRIARDTAERTHLIRALRARGASLRAIAVAAGLTHTRVRQLAPDAPPTAPARFQKRGGQVLVRGAPGPPAPLDRRPKPPPRRVD